MLLNVNLENWKNIFCNNICSYKIALKVSAHLGKIVHLSQCKAAFPNTYLCMSHQSTGADEGDLSHFSFRHRLKISPFPLIYWKKLPSVKELIFLVSVTIYNFSTSSWLTLYITVCFMHFISVKYGSSLGTPLKIIPRSEYIYKYEKVITLPNTSNWFWFRLVWTLFYKPLNDNKHLVALLLV